jgi:hypothetical protein
MHNEEKSYNIIRQFWAKTECVADGRLIIDDNYFAMGHFIYNLYYGLTLFTSVCSAGLSVSKFSPLPGA